MIVVHGETLWSPALQPMDDDDDDDVWFNLKRALLLVVICRFKAHFARLASKTYI